MGFPRLQRHHLYIELVLWSMFYSQNDWSSTQSIEIMIISNCLQFHQWLIADSKHIKQNGNHNMINIHLWPVMGWAFIVRRAGLLWSQQDFEWWWSVPLFKCLTVLEFSFILFDLCLLITFFNFIMNYVPIVTFWIFTYNKIWILSIMFCFIWSCWIIYFLACLEGFWRVVS